MISEATIPIFPLNIVLFPELPLPLHIFEERYKIMIQECLDDKKEFGVIYSKDNRIQTVGCTAKILQILKKYDDGRMDILTQGVRRFKIKELSEERIYLESDVTFLEDIEESETDELVNLSKEGIKLLKDLERLTLNKNDLSFIEKLDIGIISFIISGLSGLTMNEKQQFLEMTSPSERLRQSVAALKRVIDEVKKSKLFEKIDRKKSNLHRFSNN
jgi:Lon protease-like protein